MEGLQLLSFSPNKIYAHPEALMFHNNLSSTQSFQLASIKSPKPISQDINADSTTEWVESEWAVTPLGSTIRVDAKNKNGLRQEDQMDSQSALEKNQYSCTSHKLQKDYLQPMAFSSVPTLPGYVDLTDFPENTDEIKYSPFKPAISVLNSPAQRISALKNRVLKEKLKRTPPTNKEKPVNPPRVGESQIGTKKQTSLLGYYVKKSNQHKSK